MADIAFDTSGTWAFLCTNAPQKISEVLPPRGGWSGTNPMGGLTKSQVICCHWRRGIMGISLPVHISAKVKKKGGKVGEEKCHVASREEGGGELTKEVVEKQREWR